jgi:hypothetical protein
MVSPEPRYGVPGTRDSESGMVSPEPVPGTLTAWVSRVAFDLPLPTCRRQYPDDLLGLDRSRDGLFQPFPCAQRLRPPHLSARSASTLVVSRPAQHSLAITACRFAASPKTTHCLGGSEGFVPSTVAPRASGWSDPVAAWELHPMKNNI